MKIQHNLREGNMAANGNVVRRPDRESRSPQIAAWLAVTVILGIPCLLGLAANEPKDEMHRYVETTGALTSTFTWHLEKKERTVKIAIHADNEDSWCGGNAFGRFSEWHLANPSLKIDAVRSGQAIKLSGTCDGKGVDKRLAIDDAPWFQALSYSLRDFICSDAMVVDFWLVRPDNLSAVKMRAKRQGREWQLVGGTRVETQRVRITPIGLVSHLWHGDYWFRISDGTLLRYEGVHGPPGTPLTVIQLQEEKPAALDIDRPTPSDRQGGLVFQPQLHGIP